MDITSNKEWEAFIEKTRPLYFNLINNIIKDPVISEDILQDTYMALFERKEYDNLEYVGSAIAKNNAINHYRTIIRRSKHREIGLKKADLVTYCEYDNEQYLEQVLNILGNNRSADFLKMFIKGYSYKEIAKKFNVALGTVQSTIHWARIDIRKAKSHL